MVGRSVISKSTLRGREGEGLGRGASGAGGSEEKPGKLGTNGAKPGKMGKQWGELRFT